MTPPAAAPRPVLIAGAQGSLGHAFSRICEARAIDAVACTRSALDIADADAIQRALDHYQPWAVINAAGYVRVDDAEGEAALCHRANVTGPAALASRCAANDVQLLTFSSDLVFDGHKESPYLESDQTAPLSVYGRSKASAEAATLSAFPDALVIRTSTFFGPWDRANFAARAVQALRRGEPLCAPADVTVSPTYLPDLVDTSLDLLIDRAGGLWHLVNHGVVTWAELIYAAAEAAGFKRPPVRRVTAADMRWRAKRPRNSAMGTERGVVMPPWGDALTRWAAAPAA